ncbi:MAG: pentapeptide repeat-containing protein [Methanothrix sp.]|nr:pentapeptide repeat-containing protein [Methanothrix sp.]
MVVIAILLAAIASAHGAEQIVAAQEIVDRVAAEEPVYYNNITVIGYLDLSLLPDARVPASFVLINSNLNNASFAGVTFEQDAIFWGTTFGNASFEKSGFLGYADFADASFANTSFSASSFSRPAVFDSSLFMDHVSFEDARFSEDASFNRARFLKEANFNYTKFESYSYFASAKFLGDALFSDIDFADDSDFSLASFAGRANFYQSRLNAPGFSDVVFSGPAQFGLASFSGLASFGAATFADEASFGLARFSDAAYFSGANFSKDAIFGLAKFQDIASFQGVNFDGDLNFKAATLSNVLMERAMFGSGCRIILNDTDISRFRAHWTDIRDHVVWEPGAYLALVNNYHGLGWSLDEDDCYYQYRRLDQDKKRWGWSKAIDVLAWLSCGYGVCPSYAVAWSLLTILVFGLIFWWSDGIRRSAKPLLEPIKENEVVEHATLRNALFFSTMVFLSQGPIDFLPVGKNRYHVIVEGIIGWLLLALFLVTLGRVMIR